MTIWSFSLPALYVCAFLKTSITEESEDDCVAPAVFSRLRAGVGWVDGWCRGWGFARAYLQGPGGAGKLGTYLEK